MFGVVEIDGNKYQERPQILSDVFTVTVALGITQRRLVLPGVAPFWLKGLTRDTIVAGASAVRRFGFKFGNTDGGVWYVSGGIGGLSDRVVDSCVFGDGRFPFVLVPHIFYTPTSNILMEFEDLSNNVPYTVHLGFIGSYLLPV